MRTPEKANPAEAGFGGEVSDGVLSDILPTIR
jgi:hypothetical protein